MRKRRRQNGSAPLNMVAETVGRALGTVVGHAEALAAAHPDPVGEVRDLVAAGEERVSTLGRTATARVTAVVQKTKDVVSNVTTQAKRVVGTASRAKRKVTRATSKRKTRRAARMGTKKRVKKPR